MNKQLALLLFSPCALFIAGCSNYQSITKINCYEDGYKHKKTYQSEEGKGSLYFFEHYVYINNVKTLDDQYVTVGINGSGRDDNKIGTLNYKIQYSYSKESNELLENVTYSSIHYNKNVGIVGKEIAWRDIKSDGKHTHTLTMPKEGGSVSYTNTIDLSSYRYFEYD